MMFCPQARCRTVAPDTFKVLLSQRRRWINSTIHNLMELVRVQDLCGTFCFSMQFVVFMDLVGTVVLRTYTLKGPRTETKAELARLSFPAVAICLTYSLLVQYCLSPPSNFSDAIPLLLLGAVLGLPAVLILLATGKVVYVSWMLIYLLSLPIWNFVLPVYAYWHFDDFSWGQTRQVAGEKRDRGHADKVGDAIEVNAVPLRRWEDWERSRLRKMKREAKRKADFQRAFGTRAYHNTNTLSTYTDDELRSRLDSDSGSMFSSEDDRWGMQIGQYGEENPANLPPVGLYNIDETASDGGTVDHDQLEAMLDQGWDEEDAPSSGDLTPSTSQGAYGQQSLYQAQQYAQQQPQQPYQYQQTPMKLYHLSDNGPVDSTSSLTRIDPNASSASLGSPLSPRRPSPGADGVVRYDHGYPLPAVASHGRDSPSKTSGYESRPSDRQPGQGHVKRRSGGGADGFPGTGGGSSGRSDLPQLPPVQFDRR